MRAIVTAQPYDNDPLKRHQDFLQLFFGSEQGKRVLKQILIWGFAWGTTFDKDERIHALKEGWRQCAHKVLSTATVPPGTLPTRSLKKP